LLLNIYFLYFSKRWQVIANFIEEHSKGKFKRTGKEVLNKAKDIQKSGI